VLPQASPLSACSEPTAHLSELGMRLSRAKSHTGAYSSHVTTQILPELTTRREGLTELCTSRVQASISHTIIKCQQEYELESPLAPV